MGSAAEATASLAQRKLQKRGRKVGLSPGTLLVEAGEGHSTMRVIGYGPNELEEQVISGVSELRRLLALQPVVWLNVEGVPSEATLRELGTAFSIHPLALEDIVNHSQRPKVETYGSQLFVVARMVTEKSGLVEPEQVSMILGRGYLLTFQAGQPGDCFGPVRERIEKASGRIRTAGADYLCYSLLDAIVDAWFPHLDEYGERLEALETLVLAGPTHSRMKEIRAIRWDLLKLLRVVRPLRDVVSELRSDRSELVAEETRIYLRDCHDHSLRIIEEAEMYLDIGTSLMELYLSSVSMKTNEIMRVLTVISAIFIPLTFVVGIYGMNFDTQLPGNMPELKQPYGYVVAMSAMLLAAVTMVAYFRRRGWLGLPRGDLDERG